jgi:hypothetical protein
MSGKKQITLLFDDLDHVGELDAIIKDCVKQAWPDGAPKNLYLPILDGREDRAEEAGKLRVTFKKGPEREVYVCDGQKQKLTEGTPLIYGGAWVRVNFQPFAWEMAGKGGISLMLNGVQHVKDDERFGGGGAGNFEERTIAAFEAVASADGIFE